MPSAGVVRALFKFQSVCAIMWLLTYVCFQIIMFNQYKISSFVTHPHQYGTVAVIASWY